MKQGRVRRKSEDGLDKLAREACSAIARGRVGEPLSPGRSGGNVDALLILLVYFKLRSFEALCVIGKPEGNPS